MNAAIIAGNVEIKAEATAKDILSAINVWASMPDAIGAEKIALWDVLTALRGPDENDNRQKGFTTAVIRRESVPALARHCGAMVASPEVGFVNSVSKWDRWHFEAHARSAARALGLAITGMAGSFHH